MLVALTQAAMLLISGVLTQALYLFPISPPSSLSGAATEVYKLAFPGVFSHVSETALWFLFESILKNSFIIEAENPKRGPQFSRYHLATMKGHPLSGHISFTVGGS